MPRTPPWQFEVWTEEPPDQAHPEHQVVLKSYFYFLTENEFGMYPVWIGGLPLNNVTI